ncbi:disulfide bond formation protein B [Alphaproteobacteria bacterium LSUCC0684]
MNFSSIFCADPRITLGMAAAGSTFLLGAAFFFEYVMGLEPCTLCIWQRWPHGIMAGLGLAGLLLPSGGARLMMIGGLVVLLAGAGVAFWHSGVEWGLLPGPSACSGGVPLDGDPAAALDALLASEPVRCDEVPWSLFGLSMANWNGIASLGLAGFIAIALQPGHFAGRKPQGS